MATPRLCTRCGSDRIITGATLRDYYGDTGTWSSPARLAVDAKPDALVFKDRSYGDLIMDICGACGHVDVRIENFKELYEKVSQSEGA
jgi:hypothetical protein